MLFRSVFLFFACFCGLVNFTCFEPSGRRRSASRALLHAGFAATTRLDLPLESTTALHCFAKAPLRNWLAEWTGLEPATPGVTGRYSNQLNYHSFDTACLWPLAIALQGWWVLTGSNRRHSPCKGDALPTELSTRSTTKALAFYANSWRKSTETTGKSVFYSICGSCRRCGWRGFRRSRLR